MNYLKATFHISPNSETARDVLAALAGEAGFESFEETPTGLCAYAQESLFSEEVLREALSDFPMPAITIGYTLEQAEQKDWNEAWEQAGFEPIVVSSPQLSVVIHDGRKPLSPTPGSLPVVIDARMAFGTGTHATTQLMVAQLMAAHVEGKRVLDCGCGTGILAIVAAKLGASRVVGYDIDEWSVDNTRHNARLNHADDLQVLHGDATVLQNLDGTFDVVMANINRNILLADMPRFRSVLTRGGRLIVSGFYQADIPLLAERASQLGMHQLQATQQDDWRCLVFS